MKALVKIASGPGGVEIREVPIPRPGPGEVLVKIEVTAICGTDIHVLEWSPWAQGAGLKVPTVMGHEFSGMVVQVGEGVEMPRVGARVAGETHIPCGRCFQCRTGLQHICNVERIFGVHTDGCFAEYTVLPAVCAPEVDREIPVEQVALFEPMGGPFRAVQSLDCAARTIVVTGCGPIGLFGIGWARMFGAARIIASDVSDYRLELARQMGADVLVNPKTVDLVSTARQLTEGLGVDGYVDFSGNVDAIVQGFQCLRRAGRATLFGIPGKPLTMEIANTLVLNEISVTGLHGREMFGTWYKTQAALANKRVDFGPIVTHRMSLDDFEEGFRLAGAGLAGKVLFYPGAMPTD
jgi:threonine 3-dehydrogenase